MEAMTSSIALLDVETPSINECKTEKLLPSDVRQPRLRSADRHMAPSPRCAILLLETLSAGCPPHGPSPCELFGARVHLPLLRHQLTPQGLAVRVACANGRASRESARCAVALR